MESEPIVECGEMMRCEMPSEMREEMMSGVQGWVTTVNASNAEWRMNEDEVDGKLMSEVE